MSEGDDMRGSWNSDENFTYVADPQPAVDGGDGLASVQLPSSQKANLDSMIARTASDLRDGSCSRHILSPRPCQNSLIQREINKTLYSVCL